MQFWAAKLSAFDVLKAITCWMIFFHDFIAHTTTSTVGKNSRVSNICLAKFVFFFKFIIPIKLQTRQKITKTPKILTFKIAIKLQIRQK